MHAYQPERLKASPPKSSPPIDFVAKHKALCAGATLSLVVISSIFVNAAFYQPGKHPSPLFSTRNVNTQMQVNVPRTKIASNSGTQTESGSQKRSRKSNTLSLPEKSEELLREVQTALSVRGYYTGKLDGVYGSRTKKAITSFQSDHSLEQNGSASVRLLTQILMSASASPEEVPVPKQKELAHRPSKVKTIQVSRAVEPETPSDGLVARIQSGLRNYGYDDLKVDGKMGQQTATAIQRFQLDYGMKITGEPSKQVLKKLSDIGAYKQG